MGLSFSVPPGERPPPNTQWAEQGVFLLNTVLTVVQGQALSHRNIGWEQFTDAAIRAVSRECSFVIFLLWGREAKEKRKLIDETRHSVLQAGHPSPLSYETHFKGCGRFVKTNELLRSRGFAEIQWKLA